MSVDTDPRRSAQLPEFHGMPDEITAFQRQQALFKEVQRTGEDLEFDAVLPQVIGFVPIHEREFFQKFLLKGGLNAGYLTQEDVQSMSEEMPGVLELIRNDMALVGNPTASSASIFLERNFTKAGAAPRGTTAWHIDPGLAYLLSSNNGTEFYSGRVRTFAGAYIDLESIDPKSSPVAAPDFAIVRQGSLTVHRSPIFQKDANRTFMAFSIANK